MPRVSKSEAPITMDAPQLTSREAELGEYTVSFANFHADADPAPLFRGLPDDRCQCPHWGVVLTGSVTFRYADHDEVYNAGDAFYGRPGHTPVVTAGTEVVEFSPTDELAKTNAVLAQNMSMMESAS